MTLSTPHDMLLTRKGWMVPVVILLFIAAMLTGLYSLYRILPSGNTSPPVNAVSLPAASLALTAYFPQEAEGQPSYLIIEGWVTSATEHEALPPVKLTLRRLKNDFHQTYMLQVDQNGTFEAPFIQGFTSIPQDEPVHLTAEIWLQNQAGRSMRLAEDVYLNARPPMFSDVIHYALLLAGVCMLGVFLWAFTGKNTPRKNRTAIGFSYLVIIITLALPLLAPVILPLAFPGAIKAMQDTPVGLVVTTVDSIPDAGPQWALNIGGQISRSPESSGPAAVEAHGGLLIPLYVILLSVIGGAINMTRQVPKYQEECEIQLYPDTTGSTDAARQAGEQSTTPSVTWRTELLNQYMFLISAPFLAIATYYMLIGLDLTKVPVIVMVAFSVGLISEPLLRTVTDTAERFLHQSPPAREAEKAPISETTVSVGAK